MKALCASLLLGLTCAAFAAEAPTVRVGSKKFTEAVILGDVAVELLEREGLLATHLREVGGTRVLWEALLRGELDVYAEYTGTLRQELLPQLRESDEAALRAGLAAQGLAMSAPLGFDDTYAIGMPEALAAKLGIRTLSDLQRHPGLRLGFSNEFMERADGWPSLRRVYALPQEARGLDHDLAYRALAGGELDATDLYSTDAEIRQYGLRVLKDDRRHFPEYQAVFLYRATLPEAAIRALSVVAGRISAGQMIAMNARAKLDRVSERRVAADFVAQMLGSSRPQPAPDTLAQRLARRTLEHLWLVTLSLGAAVVVALPLGVLAARRRRLGKLVLALASVIQTVPSLALLVFMIPLLGIGTAPAAMALFLYSLLPIVRNTHAGITGIALELRDSADALGLRPFPRLMWIDLPLAAPMILAGIKIAAVINVGTATLGALIGAGGYGQPILTGIRLDSVPLILEGAIPAALLALLVQGAFEVAERWLVPRGLRLRRHDA